MKKLFLLVLAYAITSADLNAKVTRYLIGNPADVNPMLYGPVLNIGGGGPDVDPAIQWMINEVRGCANCSTKVDVVVLRSSGGNGYNAPIYSMSGVDSVETLVITNRRYTYDQRVINTVRNAEIIFFAGGNQCDYIKIFKGTPIETAIESVYSRGGAIGGTSAGAAIQGEFVFDGCNGSPISSEALNNPYHRYISFTYDFFSWSFLNSVIFDTHFYQRDRMGRLMSFVARQIREGRSSSALGIGIDEETSLVINRNGVARVMGYGYVYFVLGDRFPELCEPGHPLSYSNFKIWRVGPNGTFNLANRPTSGYYTINVYNGVLSGNPY